MGDEMVDRLLQLVLTGGIRREGLVFDRGKKMFPDGVQFALHVAGVRGDGDHHVLIRHDHAELTARAVATIGVVAASPELKAITFVQSAPLA